MWHRGGADDIDHDDNRPSCIDVQTSGDDSSDNDRGRAAAVAVERVPRARCGIRHHHLRAGSRLPSRQILLLRPFQTDLITGLENRRKDTDAAYKGVAIHNIWLGLTPDEAMARIEQIDAIEIGASSQVEIGGFSGTQLDVVVVRTGLLYEPDRTSNCSFRGGLCPWLVVGPMRIVVLDTRPQAR